LSRAEDTPTIQVCSDPLVDDIRKSFRDYPADNDGFCSTGDSTLMIDAFDAYCRPGRWKMRCLLQPWNHRLIFPIIGRRIVSLNIRNLLGKILGVIYYFIRCTVRSDTPFVSAADKLLLRPG
jgi:hypothetical protein